MVNAQNWIEKHYPKQKRRQAKELNINSKILNGSLKIEGFISLEVLRCNDNKLTDLKIINCPWLTSVDCYNNKLTNLKITHCPQISELRCANNLLSSINISDLSPEKVKKIDLSNNNFSQQDLSFLGNFTNLEELNLKDNQFNGSLIHLRNMTNLRRLKIDSNDFDSGLEYLPENLSDSYRISILAPYNYNIKLWRVNNFGLVTQAKTSIYQQNQLNVRNLEEQDIKKISKTNATQRLIAAEIESCEKANNDFSQKEYLFYKRFFYTYLANRKLELENLRNKLDEEEREWLEIICEAQQENAPSSFVKKQVERAKKKLVKKLNEEELENLLTKQKEISELEKQVKSLQAQDQQYEEARIEFYPNSNLLSE